MSCNSRLVIFNLFLKCCLRNFNSITKQVQCLQELISLNLSLWNNKYDYQLLLPWYVYKQMPCYYKYLFTFQCHVSQSNFFEASHSVLYLNSFSSNKTKRSVTTVLTGIIIMYTNTIIQKENKPPFLWCTDS